ncbi:MAG: TolC family protein [Alphaproteobacteria bacterium]|nr:TolC family protein [Alphaproteobacteria bacterium]
MKKILLFVSMISTSPMALSLDPFFVYTQNTPEGCINADTTKELDLPTLIQIGICHNPALNRDYMSVKASEAALGATKSDYLPTVDATASASKSSAKIEGNKKETTSPYSGNIGLKWLIYDFGARGATTDQMQAYLNSASFSYNASLKNTVLAINQAYFDYLSNEEVLKSTQETMKSYKKSFEETSKRYKLGMAALSDKLLAQTTYKKSELAVIEAKNALKKSGATLATLLNLPTDTEFKLTLPPKDKDITAISTQMSVQEMMEEALKLRPELKNAESKEKAAKYSIDIAKASHYPSLSANASAGYNNYWSGDKSYRATGSAGLSLSVPLFNGFRTTYDVAKARYQYAEAQHTTVETQDSVKKEVFNAYQDYQTAVSAYKVNKDVLESAKESERVSFKSYQAGKESILNLLTTQAELASARQGVATSFYNVLIAKANLYRAIGQF